MKQPYECPVAESVPVTVTNFYCTNGSQSVVTQSDKGTESYDYGETW